MNEDARRQEGSAEDLSDLLCEVSQQFANDSRTRLFLQAGERLLLEGLARESGGRPQNRGAKSRTLLDELSNLISRNRVLEEAQRDWESRGSEGKEPTEGAFRYRWSEQERFLRDLVIYTTLSRLEMPRQTWDPAALLDRQNGPADKIIDAITYHEVSDHYHDKSFRLQMVFQAILSHDSQVADSLRRVDSTNMQSWREFYVRLLKQSGLKLRPDVTVDDLTLALHVAGQGAIFRSLLESENCPPYYSRTIDHESQTGLLGKIAMAILNAFIDSGDHKGLREVTRELLSPTPRA